MTVNCKDNNQMQFKTWFECIDVRLVLSSLKHADYNQPKMDGC